jgi:hypothetical protein
MICDRATTRFLVLVLVLLAWMSAPALSQPAARDAQPFAERFRDIRWPNAAQAPQAARAAAEPKPAVSVEQALYLIRSNLLMQCDDARCSWRFLNRVSETGNRDARSRLRHSTLRRGRMPAYRRGLAQRAREAST